MYLKKLFNCSLVSSSPLHLFKRISSTHLNGQRNYASEKRKDQKAKTFIKFNKSSLNFSYPLPKLPPKWQPYLDLIRFDKPIGGWLLYFPCVYGISLATPFGHLPSFYYLGLFGAGSFLMRSAGCIINDLWDKDLDKLVKRTLNRPLASGAISERNSVIMLSGLLTSSLAVLLTLNPICIAIGVLSMIPVVAYPLAKRYTQFPQLALGLTFNIGAFMGYAQIAGQINLPLTSLLYLSCVCWTLHYDTVYALQDIEDDKKAEIKSLARWITECTDNDPRRLLKERLFDENESRKRMENFLTGSMIASLAFLSGAMYMKGLSATGNLALIGLGFYLHQRVG